MVGDHRGRLTYFRKDDRLEADFVAEMPTGLFVIEVTAEREVDGDKLRSAAAVAKQLGAQGQWVVHGGMTETERDGVRLLTLERFLLAPERVLSW